MLRNVTTEVYEYITRTTYLPCGSRALSGELMHHGKKILCLASNRVSNRLQLRLFDK